MPNSFPATNCESCPVQELPVFRHLSPGDWRQFRRLRTPNLYRRGSAVFYEGNRPLGLYFICRGRVKLVKDDINGRRQIVRTVEAPDLLGEQAFFAEQPYVWAGEVMEDAHICFVEARHVCSLFGQYTDTFRLLAKRFALELGRIQEYMHCLAVCTVRARVATHLLRSWISSSCVKPSPEEFILSESRVELAEALGTTPEAVSRTLAEFCSKGWIALEGRQVRIVDEDRLRRVACLPDQRCEQS